MHQRPTKEVFVSVGHQLTHEQSSFLGKIKELLTELECAPILIERKSQMISDPIAVIRNVIRKSAGTIIIGFERYRILDVLEYRGEQEPQSVSPRSTVTVWNQIEAAMTLQLEHPVLILLEEGIYCEGVLDPDIHPIHTFATDGRGDALPTHISEVLEEWCKLL